MGTRRKPLRASQAFRMMKPDINTKTDDLGPVNASGQLRFTRVGPN